MTVTRPKQTEQPKNLDIQRSQHRRKRLSRMWQRSIVRGGDSIRTCVPPGCQSKQAAVDGPNGTDNGKDCQKPIGWMQRRGEPRRQTECGETISDVCRYWQPGG